MKVLLDTHVLLWWLSDDVKLSERARLTINNPSNQVYVSAVSGWEISIKHALSRLDVDVDKLMDEVEHNGFMLLNISFQHGITAGGLPSHHRDPFDRMLIAQAQCEQLQLISVDAYFSDYDVDVLW
ncbi:MAG: type II toxin-antitoxin system VapC family toxin [Mariprofundaceae bacterium]|nr:type II toxin-antitoxin system VapC family toxin [Mariprofundaceae bacterium]